MRDYSKVSPRFWTGDTGKQIRKLGPQAQVVAFYLFTCPSANMIGLYYLGLPTLCHETGSPLQGALKALRSLSEVGFAYYDLPSEHVYLPNMAREQIGERLLKKDHRHLGVLRELEKLRKTPFFRQFVEKYRDAFELKELEISPESISPLEAPLEPLRSQEQEQEQEQKQEQEQEQEQESDPSGAADRIFQHWKATHEHPQSLLDDKRRKLIISRLKDYSEADLCQSITGYLNSPHNMGRNDTNTKYDSVELLLRDNQHVDKGLKCYAEPPSAGFSKLTRANADATADWQPPEMRRAAT